MLCLVNAGAIELKTSARRQWSSQRRILPVAASIGYCQQVRQTRPPPRAGQQWNSVTLGELLHALGVLFTPLRGGQRSSPKSAALLVPTRCDAHRSAKQLGVSGFISGFISGFMVVEPSGGQVRQRAVPQGVSMHACMCVRAVALACGVYSGGEVGSDSTPEPAAAAAAV